MKTISTAFATLLVITSAAHAAPIKGSISSSDHSALGFEIHAPWAKAWGARSGDPDRDSSQAGKHRRNHPELVKPQSSKWSHFLGTPPGWANKPDSTHVRTTPPVSTQAQPVPDGGSSLALLGLSVFGLVKTRGLLKNRS